MTCGSERESGRRMWENWGTRKDEPQPRTWRSAAGALTDQILREVIG